MDYYSTIVSSTGSSSMANNNNNNTKQKKNNNKGGSKKSSNKGVVKLSTDPQSVAARERRHRISDRFKILQSLVPGGTKMDTVSMLDEAIHYVKFLKTQIWLHQTMINFVDVDDSATSLFVNNNNNNPVVLPAIPSNDHQAAAFNYSNTDLVAAPVLQQPAQLQPLSMQDSCFHGDQETIRYDA